MKTNITDRTIIEWHNGFKLDKSIQVHHINGIKSDNSIDNLLSVKKQAHSNLHARNVAELKSYSDKHILISGGCGFLGYNLALYLYSYSKARIVIYSRDDYKHEIMKEKLSKLKLDMSRFDFFIGDICDLDRLKFATKYINTIVHAAAWKVVPSAELNPSECIKTNVYGSDNIIKAALFNNCRKVIGISTDKAAGEICNTYGHTKKLMENAFINANNYNKDGYPQFLIARYGNVAKSTLSIIPKLMEDSVNGEINITNPDMTRFHMSISMAVETIIKCMTLGNPRDIWIRKAPSYKLSDLAEAFKKITGCKINIIGTRAGERQYESLVSLQDSYFAENLSDFYVLNKKNSNEKPFEYRSDNNTMLSRDELYRYLLSDWNYRVKLDQADLFPLNKTPESFTMESGL